MHTAHLAVVLALLTQAPPNSAHGERVVLREAWMPAVRAGQDASVYLQFDNQTSVDLVIRRVRASIAQSTYSTIRRDVPLDVPEFSSGFTVIAHRALSMSSAQGHLVLRAVARDLKPGEHVPLVLDGPDGMSITVPVLVRAVARKSTPSNSRKEKKQ